MTAALEFGRWVRSRRLELMLTQEQLADRAGVSVRTVRNLEAGRSGVPRLETQRLMTAALGTADLVPAEPERRPAPAPGAPALLPADIGGFTGRAEELARLDGLCAAHRTDPASPMAISVIVGTAGVGKTTLAVHWAHRARRWFPDGQLYVDLRGFSAGASLVRPIDALARFLRALGVQAEHLPTDVEVAADLYRTMLADRHMLVLLDNGRDPDQVRPLLPGGEGNFVLVTSRDHLSGLVAREGATRIGMTRFGPDEARTLLQRTLGAERVAAEPVAVAELARLCAFLPLALRIAATNLYGQPHLALAGYVAALRRDRLGGLAVPGDEHSAVRAAFDQSYLALPEPARRLFRRLGLMPGPDVDPVSASVLGDVPVTEAVDLLGLLTRAHLIEDRGADRYGYHDILGQYARESAGLEEDESARQAVLARLHRHYLRMVDCAASVLYPHLVRLPAAEAEPGSVLDGPTDDVDDKAGAFDDPGRASAWLEAERVNLVATIDHAAVHGPRSVAWHLADGIRGYLMARMYTVEWLSVAGAGLAAARAAGDLSGQAAAELSLATFYSRLGEQERAIEGYSRALDLAKESGWVDGAAAAHGSLGNVYLRLGRAEAASANFAEVLAHARRVGRPAAQAAILSNLGLASLELGRLAAAVDQLEESLALAGMAAARTIEANTHTNLGEACHALGQFDRARDHFDQALDLHRELGDTDSEAATLTCQASLLRDRGDHLEALALADRALTLARSGGHRRNEVDSLNVRGSILARMGLPGPAVDQHRRALDLAERTGYRYALTASLSGQATGLGQLGELQTALAAARTAVQLATDHDYRIRAGVAECVVAELLLVLGDADAARAAAERALAIHRETGHRLGEGRALLVLGRAIVSPGTVSISDAEAARRYTLAALAIFDDLGAEDVAAARALLDSLPSPPTGPGD